MLCAAACNRPSNREIKTKYKIKEFNVLAELFFNAIKIFILRN